MYYFGKGDLEEDKSKALKLYQKACNLGNASACEHAGCIYKFLPEGKSQFVEWFKKACDLGNGQGCAEVGDFYKDEKKYKIAANFFEKGCELDGNGCYSFIELRQKGYVLQDAHKIIKYYKKMCNEKYGAYYSCYELGTLYENGQIVRQDYQKAAEYYKKACQKNDIKSCKAYASLIKQGKAIKKDNKVSNMYVMKVFTEADKNHNYKKASKLLKEACDKLNGKGCSYLGYLYYVGLGVDKDSYKAEELSEKACALNDSYGCYLYAIIRFENENVLKKYEKAPKALDKACNDYGFADACFRLGKIFYYWGVVNSKKSDTDKAIKLFEKACNGGSGSGCNEIAHLFFLNKKFGQWVAFSKKSCDLNNATGCYQLGFAYQGIGVVKDYKKSAEYYKKACDLGSKYGCKDYKEMLLKIRAGEESLDY
jgi:TPR repeat protein